MRQSRRIGFIGDCPVCVERQQLEHVCGCLAQGGHHVQEVATQAAVDGGAVPDGEPGTGAEARTQWKHRAPFRAGQPHQLRGPYAGGPQDGSRSPPSCSPTDSSLRSSYEPSDSDGVWLGDAGLQAGRRVVWDRCAPIAPPDGPDGQPQLPPPSRLGCLRSLAGTLYARGEVTAELGVLWQIVTMAHEAAPPGRSSSSSGRLPLEAVLPPPTAAPAIDGDGYMVETFERDSANARTLVIVHRRIGSCLVSLGRQAEAVEELRACVSAAHALLSAAAADPDVLAAQVMLGSVLHRVGDLGKAQRQLEQHLPLLLAEPAHANSPLTRQGMLALGDCLARCKRHEEAVRAFRKAAVMFQAAGLPEGHGRALQQAMHCQEALVQTARRPRMLSFAVSQMRMSIGRDRASVSAGASHQGSSDGG